MLGAVHAVAAAQTSTAKIVIIVGATHGETPKYRSNANELYAEAIKHTPNVITGLQPQRHVVRGQGGNGRRERRDLPRARQRLAQPVHLRPHLQDEERFRAQRGRRARATTTTCTTASPTSARSTLPRSAIVFLHHLCYASGNSEPEQQPNAEHREGSASITTARPSSPPAPRRSSPTATATRATTCRPCSRPLSRWPSSGAARRITTATTSPSTRPAARAPRSSTRTPAGPARRASTARSSATSARCPTRSSA